MLACKSGAVILSCHSTSKVSQVLWYCLVISRCTCVKQSESSVVVLPCHITLHMSQAKRVRCCGTVLSYHAAQESSKASQVL